MMFARNFVPALTGPPFAVFLWALWSSGPGSWWLVWLVAKIVSSALRFALTAAHTRGRSAFSPRGWERAYLALLFVDGVVWSFLAIGFAGPDTLVERSVMLATIVGIAGVGSSVLSMHFGGNVTFSGGVLVPAAVYQFAQGDRIGIFAGASFLFVLGLVLFGGRRSAEGTTDLLRLRFEMADLAQQREEALVHATRSSEAKSRFLATVSHELRTPLHGILGALRMLRDARLDPAARSTLELVERSGGHLLEVINDVLDYSRIEAGKLEVRARPCDAAKIVYDVAELLRQAAVSRVSVSVAGTLPGSAWAVIDGARMRQVLLNLVGNAVKFTERGSVTIRPSWADGELTVAVEDTGPGIAIEERARIFEAFHQADDSYAREYAGTGLGLAISRAIARAMGGDLAVESEVGVGTTFTLRVPAPASGPDQAQDRPSMLPRLTGRALVVEDNAANVLVATSALERLGVTATVASDGPAGIALFQASRPDIVLLDCHMPGMDGFEVAEIIRRLEKSGHSAPVPIVAVTASGDANLRARCLAAGMNDVLTKPFAEHDLAAAMAPYLDVAASVGPTPTQRLGPVRERNAADPFPQRGEAIARLGGDAGLYVKVAERFAEDHRDAVSAIEALLAQGRRADAQRAAHTLKGLAATLGAPQLREAAAALDAQLRGEADASAAVSALRAQLDVAIRHLDDRRQVLGAAVTSTAAG